MNKKVLILTQYGLPEQKRNMNAYQRVFYGSRFAEVTLLIRKRQPVSKEIRERVSVRRAPFENRWLFFIYSILFALTARFRRCRVILTEPSGFAAVGYFAKYLAGYFWVLDVWDRPMWRGEHERGTVPPWSDRFIFRLMRHADLYLLSVLPRAAKDIGPDPDKCLQLHNAIDLSDMAHQPPPRSPRDPVLHLSYGKSQFAETLGLDVVVKAAERLRNDGCPVKIHLIGHISEKARMRIQSSSASDLFFLHGFIEMSRTAFFRTIHAGLVAYLDREDLRYIFPIKVLEHLSQGNPVIASRLPGICAMVEHEYNGLLVEAGNAEDLARAIHRLQQDRLLWERLSQNALESVKKFEASAKNRIIFEALFDRSKGAGPASGLSSARLGARA